MVVVAAIAAWMAIEARSATQERRSRVRFAERCEGRVEDRVRALKAARDEVRRYASDHPEPTGPERRLGQTLRQNFENAAQILGFDPKADDLGRDAAPDAVLARRVRQYADRPWLLLPRDLESERGRIEREDRSATRSRDPSDGVAETKGPRKRRKK